MELTSRVDQRVLRWVRLVGRRKEEPMDSSPSTPSTPHHVTASDPSPSDKPPERGKAVRYTNNENMA